MTRPPDRTQPTQPLPPAMPPHAVDPVAVAAADEVLWRDEVRSRLRSLTTAMTVVVAVAFIALGVAVWALLDESRDGGGAGGERVRALQERVSRLENLAAKGASRQAIVELQEQQRAVADRLVALGDATASVATLQTSIDGLEQAVAQLDQRITALERTAP